MAYMSQEHKKEIAVLLKEVMPKKWKYSLAVNNHSTIVLTISKADVDLIGMHKQLSPENKDKVTNFQLNHYYLHNAYDGEVLEKMEEIVKVLNHKNYDNSDVQSDYFDVGHYVNLNIGNWKKPFELID